MEILELPGYTFEEKVHIAQNHLIPKQLREHGLSADAIDITEKALIKIIMAYTREAGVRNLERRIADVCRAVAVEVASGKVAASAKRTSTRPTSRRCSGRRSSTTRPPSARRSRASRPASPGRRPAATSSSSRRPR